MEKNRVLEKNYYIIIRQFEDQESRSRQELDIIPELVYKTSKSIRDGRNLHLIWYSSPDPKEYNTWDFNRLIINIMYREILSETPLITEIMTMSDHIQPQDFEEILKKLGFHRK